MSGILSDLRFGLRVLRQGRLATVVALVALALGTGANTAIFSVVNSVLLRPLNYHEPDRLVTILGPNSAPVAPAVFLDVRRQSTSFATVEAAQAWGANLTGAGIPERVTGLSVTPGMFALLGNPPLLGRADMPEPHTLVISHGLWMRRFGGAATAIGEKVSLDGEPYTITGVMPAGFRFAPFWVTDAEMWAPLDLHDRLTDRRGSSLRIFARLNDRASTTTAQSELTRISAALAAAWPESNARLDLRVDPLQEKVVGRIRPALLILLGAVALVLLIACANVANLALARAAARRREIAIRVSLGAARGRLLRQLLTESLMLSLSGGALGWLLAAWGIRMAAASALPLPRAAEIAMDARVLIFTFMIAAGTGVLFGLAPALAAMRAANADTLRSGRGNSAGNRSRRFLVASEVALAFVLLAGAGLLLRSFTQLRNINPGFDSSHLLTLSISVAGQPNYDNPDARETLYKRLIESVQQAPGIRHVAMISHLPLAGDVWGTHYRLEGRPAPAPGEEPGAVFRAAFPGYFRALAIPLHAGRDFEARDRAGAPKVVIINQTLARRDFAGASPLGRRISTDDGKTWMTVIGVVGDVRQGSWADAPENEIYMPFAQDTNGFRDGKGGHVAAMMMAVRTHGDPAAASSAVRAAIWSVERNLPVSAMKSMDEVIEHATSQSRLETWLIGTFAALALVLAVIGIYGVIAYEVTRRSREIGIRIALGSTAAATLRLVLRESLAVSSAGLAAGLLLALPLAGFLRAMLYQVTPLDPAVFTIVGVLLLTTALCAGLAPAIRAARIDPAIALREE